MKLISTILAAALSLSLTACATTNSGSNWTPIIDTQIPSTTLQTDIQECQAYARQTASASDGAAAGAIAGALLGALLMAAAGSNGHDNRSMAWVGALSGGASGGVRAETDQRTLISRCLAGRGHRVLN